MAKIDNYLRAILIARYGEDVRGSIHDAIELINSIAGIKYGTSVTSPTDPTGTYEEGTLYLNTSTGDLWSMIGKDLWDLVINIIGPPGANGTNGKNGQDAPKIVGNNFVSQVGLIRTYELVLDDGSAFQYQVSDGQSGSGTGDMTKSVYDIDNDGKVDAAEVADKVGNANTTVLEDLSEDSDGDLNYKGNKIGGAVKVDGTTIEKNANDELTLAGSVVAKLDEVSEQILGVISGDTVTFTDSKYIGGTDDYLLDPYISDTDRFLKSQSISGNTLTVVCDDVIASGSVAVCLAFKKGV